MESRSRAHTGLQCTEPQTRTHLGYRIGYALPSLRMRLALMRLQVKPWQTTAGARCSTPALRCVCSALLLVDRVSTQGASACTCCVYMRVALRSESSDRLSLLVCAARPAALVGGRHSSRRFLKSLARTTCGVDRSQLRASCAAAAALDIDSRTCKHMRMSASHCLAALLAFSCATLLPISLHSTRVSADRVSTTRRRRC